MGGKFWLVVGGCVWLWLVLGGFGSFLVLACTDFCYVLKLQHLNFKGSFSNGRLLYITVLLVLCRIQWYICIYHRPKGISNKN